MNLAATVSLFFGGEGSGCNPAVGHCGRKIRSLEKMVSSKIRMFDKKEADRVMGEVAKMNAVGFDSRLLQKKFYGSIRPILPNDFALPGAAGVFNNKDGIRMDPRYIEWAFIHEFGHWLDDAWLNVGKSSHGPKKPANVDAKALTQSVIRVRKEFRTAKDIAIRSSLEKKVGVFTSNALGKETPIAVSAYALSSPVEWFADSFKAYYGSPDSRKFLEEAAPETYGLINGLATGKFFKGQTDVN